MVLEALQKFDVAFKTNQKKAEGSMWQFMEKRFGAQLKEYKEKYGYYDLFLITKDGYIVYTVSKGSDLGQNLVEGSLKDSSLGKCFQNALKKIGIQDFEPYAPSKNQFAAFIGAPVKKKDQVVGVIALRLPTEPVNVIVQRRNGMGKSGETYLVGKHEGKIAFRSDMLTVGDGKFVLGYEISTPYIESALAGKESREIHTDSSGKLVMVAYNPLAIEGLNWASISRIELEEAIAPKLVGEEEDFYSKYIKNYGYYDLFLIHNK